MKDNLNLTHGLIFSQAVMLALTKKGLSREESYKLVQRNAMKVWDENISFFEALKRDNEFLEVISINEIEDIFKLENRLKNLDTIFTRVGLG
jgi:adenylosuccinate lyase